MLSPKTGIPDSSGHGGLWQSWKSHPRRGSREGHIHPRGSVAHSGFVGTREAVGQQMSSWRWSCHTPYTPVSLNSWDFEQWGRARRKKGVTELLPDLQAQRFVFSEKTHVTDLYQIVPDHDFPESYLHRKTQQLATVLKKTPKLNSIVQLTSCLLLPLTEFCFRHTGSLSVPALRRAFSEPSQRLFLLLGTLFLPPPGSHPSGLSLNVSPPGRLPRLA